MDKSTVARESTSRRVSESVEQICAADVEPPVKARMLRELAAWYRDFAGRAANPAIWESRLFTADHLEMEAGRIDGQQEGRPSELAARGDNS